jgi:hypothetical protein
MRYMLVALALALGGLLHGCLLTKAMTVPLRVGGAVISVLPGVGNPADATIDTTADVIDEVPL